MRSSAPGKDASPAEVQDISRSGIWLLVRGKEYFLPFADYPWFKDAKPAAICDLKLFHGTHLRWPALDIDLELESLRQPEKYPLVFKDERACVAEGSKGASSTKKGRKSSK